MPKPLIEVGVCRRPEHYASWGSKDGKPHFPEKCSECGANLINPNDCNSNEKLAMYECGAKYEYKSQSQNHTTVYWGVCPNG